MKLIDTLQDVNYISIIGNNDIEISNLSQDTREGFIEGTAYFAVKGTQIDGHIFIEQAIQKGACAIFCEQLPEKIIETVQYVVLESVISVMGNIVANFYGNPSRNMKIIAVTGTNGKTTIATVLYQSLLALGEKAALFSTAGDFINGVEFHSEKKASSSMEIIEFQKNLKKALEQNCKYICIEATSHALDQKRLVGTDIFGAIFTNLTQDHLDYHGDIHSYSRAKKKLFDMLREESFSLINSDDSYGPIMVSETKSRIINYGDALHKNTLNRDLTFEIMGFGLTGTKLKVNDSIIEVPFVGTFNMYNILAVYGVLRELDYSKENIARVLSTIKGARGRMEIVTGKRETVVGIVDYAHTPDALENVLKTLKELPHNKIITLVGVGGDRDRLKRPQMAKIAQEGSDYVVFTSDNPRTESPEQIFSDLLAGCDTLNKNFEKIEDREEAIKKAISISGPGDIILVAGKGHEDYQIIGTKKHHFDDKVVLEKYL
jgi:UDP-N-acetylmuramoyl-L-alanyl-D-glutamate--2,6-diaminopimelate ligase